MSLDALGGGAAGFGFRKPAAAQRGSRSAWAPPSPPYAWSHLDEEGVALCGPSLESKPRQLQMLNSNVGVGKEVGFMVSQRDELLRYGSADNQAPDATSGSKAHDQQHDRAGNPTQDA